MENEEYEKMFADPKGDLFAKRAKEEIQPKYQDFFDNHPMNTGDYKHDISFHCAFVTDNGRLGFAVAESWMLPTGVVEDLQALFREIYLS